MASLCAAALTVTLTSAPTKAGAAHPDATTTASARFPMSCADRKFDVFVMVGWHVSRVADAITAALVSPPVVGAGLADRTLRRLDRQYDAGLRDCPRSRLRAVRAFIAEARPLLTGGAMDQTTVEELLVALDRYEERETGEPVERTSVQRLRACQERLPQIHASYRISYSGPKPFGRNGWVTLAVDNTTDKDLYVDLAGSMVAVRPLPNQGGEWSKARGGWVYWWGGSSSDLMLAEAHATTEGYAAPAWYKLRLREDGFIKAVRPEMIVTFGRHLGCSAPVRPAGP
jgi:hypothetical protein